MKMTKKIMLLCLILFAASPLFANKKTILSTQHQMDNWKFESQEDGMYFILGEYTHKLLTIHTNEIIKNRMKADIVTVSCNAFDEDVYRDHRLEPGSSLTCKGNFQDTASLYIAPNDFKNGAQGSYEFQPINSTK